MQQLTDGPDGASISPSLSALYATPPIPVLAGTLLCLELLLLQQAPDLRSLTELLRSDPGAILRLYSLLAEEFPDPQDRPERLEECIASVPGERLLRSLATPMPVREEQLRMIAFARHASTIGWYARQAAASLALCPERAYLIGLLHSIGTLPAELGRTSPHSGSVSPAATAATLAHRHQLPDVVSIALDAVHREAAGSVWTAVIHAAHDLAARAEASGEIRLPSASVNPGRLPSSYLIDS